jgi:hypothetical protein
MSGFMRKAALVVGAVALVATTAGLAAPAVAATATTAAAAGGVAGISAATLAAIGTYGGLAAGVLSAVSAATAPGMSNQGSATSFQTNPQSGLPYAMGRTRMSGLRIFADTNTRPGYTKFNDLLWFGAMLSIGGQIEQVERFTIDNEVVTFDGSGNAVGNYRDYQGQKLHMGGPQASAVALTLGGGSAPGWSAPHRLSGITHAMWALRYNKEGEMYGAGAPEPAWIGKWVRVYDPRLDSTYPGGSGPCRALDETTYVWSQNPGLHALTWALGRWQNGKRTCGIGAPVSTIRIGDFVECANVCDANAWKVGGVEWTTDSKWDTLKRILQAGGARPTKTGAMIGCMVSTPRTAIATIESRHLLDSLSIAATKSRRDRFNSVIPRYVDEDSDWSVISGTAITVPEYVTADKGQRTKEIDYPLVQVFSGETAMQPGQLAAYDIVNSREAGPITFTTGPEWIGLKTGDVVLLNVPEEGLANQPILITRRAPDPATGKVSFAAQTETYSKHAYALGQSTTPPAPFSLTPPDLKPPAPVSASWAASGTTTGEGLPAIIVVGESDMPSADAVLIDYRKVGDDDWNRAAIVSANAPVQHVIAPLESETGYQVRIGYRVEQIDGDFIILGAITGVGKLSGIEDGATVGGTIGVDIRIPEIPGIPAPPGLIRNDLLKLRKDGGLVYQPYGDPAVEIELGKIELPDIGAASESVWRQLDDAVDRLGHAVAQALTEASRTRETFRDAGVYVDPVTGTVKIAAVEQTAERVSEAYIRLSAAESAITLRATRTYVDSAIATAVLDPSQVPIFEGLDIRITSAELRLDGAEASINQKASVFDLNAQGARLSTAEQTIDALNGRIEQKVDTVDFTALGERVTSAETTLSALGDTAGITQAVIVARRLPIDVGKAQENTLLALLEGDAAKRGSISALASARQELTAGITDARTAIAVARQELIVRIGAADASALIETRLRIEGDQVLATQITNLTTSIDGQLAAFDQRIFSLVQNDNLITAGLAQTVSAVRGLGDDAAAAAETALMTLLTGDRTKREQAGAIAAARQELTVKINGDVEVVVQRVSALLARMGVAEASIVAEQLARVTADVAIASQLSQLGASLGTVDARVAAEELARATQYEALAASIQTLTAEIEDGDAALAAQAVLDRQARVSGDGVLAASIDQLRAEKNSDDAVLVAQANLDRQARVEGDSVIAASVDDLRALREDDLTAILANASVDRQARIDGDTALASSVDELRALRDDDISAILANASLDRQARIDGDTAVAASVDTLRAEKNSGDAALAAQANLDRQARIDGDGALAARQDTLTATVNDISGQVVEQAAVLVDLEGKVIAYFRVAATDPDGTTYLEIVRSNGTGVIVLGGNTKILGDVITPGSITAREIEANGVTRTFSATNSAAAVLSTEMADIVTFTVTMNRPGTIMVNAVHQLVFATGGAWEAELKVGTETLMSESGNIDHKSMLIGSFYASAPGNYVVHLRARRTAGAVSINAGGSVMLVHRTYA